MTAWPEIADTELLARLSLPHREFVEHVEERLRGVPRREYTEAALGHALGYPWARPARSYVLRGDLVELLDELSETDRRELLERFTGHGGRTALLAFGSNGAPDTLRRKLAHLAAPDDRDVLAIAGHLHNFDVGASAHLALYGAMPATIFPSPGTAVRCAILWLTRSQFTQLVWSELSYALGRLRTRFEADEPEHSVEEVTALVSRFGCFAPDGTPIALTAIPARGRRAPALSQDQLLTLVARRALGAGAGAPDLLRTAFADFAATVARLIPVVRERGAPFSSPLWSRFPAAPP